MTGAVAETSVEIVVDEVLLVSKIAVFRARGNASGSLRCVMHVHGGAPPRAGEVWRLVGRWRRHARHGRQLEVRTAAPLRPAGRDMLLAVLAEDRERFPGIGAARATTLWDAFGASVFDLLDAGDPAIFADLLGMPLAEVLVSGWRDLDAHGAVWRWLAEHGFSPWLARRLVRVYGPSFRAGRAEGAGVVELLAADPYRMLAFAGWRAVDGCALRMGIAPGDPRRLVGAVEAVFAAALAEGHTWLPERGLVAKVAGKTGLDAEICGGAGAHALAVGGLRAFAGGLQAPGVYVMERFVEEAVLSRARAPADPDAAAGSSVGLYAATVAMTDEQRQAVATAAGAGFAMILGGPGVGKTTVLRALVAVVEAKGSRVGQVALSGRAARRMTEATVRPAQTIASLILEMERGASSLRAGDVLVVDEASMLDLLTAYRILRRIPAGVGLVLVGDPGQLAPIGPGLVLHALVERAEALGLPSVTLTKVFRQNEADGIPAVCREVREGRAPELARPDFGDLRGVSFIEAAAGDVTRAVLDVVALCGGVDRVQVVGAVKRGDGGVADVNLAIADRRAVRPTTRPGYVAGDRIVVVTNDRDLGVMNGDLAIVVSTGRHGELVCTFDGDREVVLPAGFVTEAVEYGFAITCHKAQGSGFPVVVVPIVASRLLDRTMLLTAISRAEIAAVVVGSREAFAEAVAAPPAPGSRLVGIFRGTRDGVDDDLGTA